MKIRFQSKPPKHVTWSVTKFSKERLLIGLDREGAICRSSFLNRRHGADIVTEWQAEWKYTLFEPGKPPKDLSKLAVLLVGSIFQQKVWKRALKIPYGKVMSYADVAASIGVPRAARAVGMACGVCPIDYVVPMHRIVGSHGLGGFGRLGRENKRQLLKSEGVHYAPIKIKTAKLYLRRETQIETYRRFLDTHSVSL